MIAYNDRVLAVGRTRSGKSEWLNVLFSQLRCQRLMVDPKDEFLIAGDPDDDGEPVPIVYAVDQLDWQRRTLHVVPREWDPDEWENLWRACNGRRRLNVTIHESGPATEFTGRTGPAHATYISQGQAHGLGYFAGSQRSKCLASYATSEPGHVAAFAEKQSRDDDHTTLAAMLDLNRNDLATYQRELVAEHGPHAFLLRDRSNGTLTRWAPLPEHIRNLSCVERRTVA